MFSFNFSDLFHVLHGEVWRLITSFFVFQNSAQTIVGLILLYTCRQFERQMGSKKFGAFLIFSSVVSTLLCIAMIVVASSIGFYLVPSSGPFALIFALMINYFCKSGNSGYILALQSAAVITIRTSSPFSLRAHSQVTRDAVFLRRPGPVREELDLPSSATAAAVRWPAERAGCGRGPAGGVPV